MSRLNLLVLSVLAFVSRFDVAVALYNHATDCTLPNNTADIIFVQNPNVRGTIQIAWLCLFTLFVCTYQVLHLNVPPLRQDGTPSTQFWKTIRWAIIVIVAPEFILVESINDLYDARTGLKELRKASGGVNWTLTHMFYADMGGFVIRHRGHGDLTISGRLLTRAMHEGLIDESPPLSREEIMDKSKDNPYTKALAILQIAYFYAEFSLRFVQKLPVTQLELAVASVAGYAFISYALLWYKPKGVGVATLITAQDGKQRDLETMTVANMSMFGDVSNNEYELQEQQDWHNQASKSVASLGRAWTNRSDKKVALLGLIFILFSAPLGAVHLIAWNWHFPTIIDMWLWRTCSIAATTGGFALLPIGMMAMLMSFCWEGFTVVIALPLAGLVAVAYVLARLALIAEMIRCLFYLEPGAFVSTDWISIIPHIG